MEEEQRVALANKEREGVGERQRWSFCVIVRLQLNTNL